MLNKQSHLKQLDGSARLADLLVVGDRQVEEVLHLVQVLRLRLHGVEVGVEREQQLVPVSKVMNFGFKNGEFCVKNGEF